MRTVSTKKELVKAIKDGETNIKIDSLKLYVACKLADKYESIKSLLVSYFKGRTKEDAEEIGQDLKPQIPAGDGNTRMIAGSTVVVITISVLVAAVSIIAVLKDKNVKIKFTGSGFDIEIVSKDENK